MDEQAIDRLHRLGQTRPVTAVRLLCAGTVEVRILELQQRKLRLGAAVTQLLTPEEARDLLVKQLQRLFATE